MGLWNAKERHHGLCVSSFFKERKSALCFVDFGVMIYLTLHSCKIMHIYGHCGLKCSYSHVCNSFVHEVAHDAPFLKPTFDGLRGLLAGSTQKL